MAPDFHSILLKSSLEFRVNVAKDLSLECGDPSPLLPATGFTPLDFNKAAASRSRPKR